MQCHAFEPRRKPTFRGDWTLRPDGSSLRPTSAATLGTGQNLDSRGVRHSRNHRRTPMPSGYAPCPVETGAAPPICTGTTASADFCRLNRPLRSGFSSATSVGRSPRVRTLTFPSCRRRIYVRNPWSYRTSLCLASSSGCARLMRFVFLGARVCRRLPSDSTSRWTPLPLASGCHDQAPQRTLTSKSTPMPGAQD